MTARYDDRLLSAWLHDVAPGREPEHLLGEVLARTARTGRRPAWRIRERFNLMYAFSSRFAPTSPVPWRLVAVVAAAVLALAAAALLTSGKLRAPAPPYGLAANGPVVFSRNGDIVAADPLGTTVRTLVGGDADDVAPLLSPDGTHLAFFRGPDGATEAWIANADGSSQHRIAAGWPAFPGSVDWSPHGDVLVMNSVTPDDSGGLVLLRTDGSGSTTIPTGLTSVDFPAFRPTAGDQISFRAKDAAGDFGFYLVNRDGTGLRRLELDSGFQDDAFYAENSEYYFDDLAWDASGTRIAFHTLEPAPDSPAGPGFRIHVADVDPGGAVSNERILQFDPEADDEFSPILIPGSTDIVFRSLEGSTHRLMRGSNVPGATATELGISAPDWLTVTLSPDGRALMVSVPDAPPSASQPRHTVLLDLANLTSTPVSVPEDFSWQRLGQ